MEDYAGYYLILPDGEGDRSDTKIAVLLTEEQIEEYLASGYILVGEEDFRKLIDCTHGIATDGTIYELPEKETTVDEAIASKLIELKAERDDREEADVEFDGYVFDFDDKSRERIEIAIVALDAAGDDATLSWTTADNEEVTVNAEYLRNILVTAAARSNTLHVQYRNLKAYLATLTDVDAIAEISFDTEV